MDLEQLLERTLSIQLKQSPDTSYSVKSIDCAVGDRLVPQAVLAMFEKTVAQDSSTHKTETVPIHYRPKYTYQSPQITEILIQGNQRLQEESCPVLRYRVEETFTNLIETLIPQLVQWQSKLYFLDRIPQDKLKNALETYAETVDPKKVIFLYDSTFWGSAQRGFLITESGFYLKTPEQSLTIKFNEIKTLDLCQERDNSNLVNVTKIILNNGETIQISENEGLQPEGVHTFLAATIALRDKGLTKDVDGYVIVENMPDSVKLNYLSLLVWLTYQDDSTIDAQELSELQVLMTQVNFSPALRSSVRQCIVSPETLDPKGLVTALLEQVPTGCEQVLEVSLLKDAIRMHRSTKKTTATTQPAIQTLAQLCAVNPAQLQFIEEACIQDERIFAGEISDGEITKIAKELAAKAGAVGVPVAAVYLSGSVMGLSAAGVTSGLAALGLGGILGLSSMVTGIGVAIALGVGIYQGAQWLMGGAAEQDKRSRRDIMLQEVLTIHRKAIANLAEDIAYLAQQLIVSTADVERNKAVIQKLSQELTIFSRAMQQMRSRETRFEQTMQNPSESQGSSK